MHTIKRIKWHHSIEKRLVIIFVLAMTLMFGIMTSISMYAGHNEKKEQEEKLVDKYLYIGLKLLGSRVDSVADMAKDYGYWDETLDFINSPNRKFVENSLDSDSLRTSSLDGVIIHNNAGKALYRISSYDYITDSQLWSLFTDINDIEKGVIQRGVVFLQGRILVYVSQPVSDNSGNMASNGRITLLREMTQRTLDEISSDLGESFSLINMLQPDAIERMAFGTEWRVEKSEIIYTDKTLEATYSIFFSDQSRLPILAELVIERSPFSIASQWRLLIPELVLLIVLSGILVAVLRATVTKPIKRLIEWLNQVNGSELAEDLRPYEYSQYGEISVLSNKFSEIYNNLYQQHQFSQLLLYSISDFIFTVDSKGKIDYCNPAAAEWLRIDSKEVYCQDFELLFAAVDENAPSVANWLYRALETLSEFSGQVNIRKLSEPNKTFLVEVQVSPILYSDTEQKGAMIILRLPK